MKTDTLVFLQYFLEYFILVLDGNMTEESEYFSNSKSSALGCCLIFANFSLVMLVKVLLTEKCVLNKEHFYGKSCSKFAPKASH